MIDIDPLDKILTLSKALTSPSYMYVIYAETECRMCLFTNVRQNNSYTFTNDMTSCQK